MTEFKVAEKFVSINGEGRRAGQPAVFVRFTGCNLNCSYCDTKWANEPTAPYTRMSAEGICGYVGKTGIVNVTLTGGEPLLQPDICTLIEKLCGDGHIVEIETNGAADILPAIKAGNENLTLTMDYKLPSSGMERFMLHDNYRHIRKCDTIKFVSGSEEDLHRTAEIIKKYSLTERCAVYISPVFGKIEPSRIVEFMLENKMNGVNLQLQLHKFIWEPNKRGV